MDDSNAQTAAEDPGFRTTKRRKVFRKREASEVNDVTFSDVTTPANAPGALIVPERQDEGDVDVMPRLQRRIQGRRGQGIGFSTADKPRGNEVAERESSQALSVATPEMHEAEILENGRFVRQTGRAGVVEDKHMLAFVDRKMAEMRSRTPATTTLGPERMQDQDIVTSSKVDEADERSDLDDSTAQSNIADGVGLGSLATTSQKPTRPFRRRSKKPGPDANDVARDNIIDQIMHESEAVVPIYTFPDTKPRLASRAGLDNDTAAAEAFKAQFLADLQQSRRRRAQPNSSAKAKAKERTTSGPKLGGSRSAREKMRAAEQARLKGKK